MQKVVVYYYSSRWVPIMFYSYSDAIALHHKARLSGQELYVFPPGLDPNDFPRQEVVCLIPSLVNQSESVLPQPQQLDALDNQEVAA